MHAAAACAAAIDKWPWIQDVAGSLASNGDGQALNPVLHTGMDNFFFYFILLFQVLIPVLYT